VTALAGGLVVDLAAVEVGLRLAKTDLTLLMQRGAAGHEDHGEG